MVLDRLPIGMRDASLVCVAPRRTPERTPEATYRPDINGLRAVAILSVLGFHANAHWLPGGFVGVDVFFVISGYLISGIIIRGLEAGRFSYSSFYAHRIKRIFPALLVVLSASVLFGWFALYTDEFEMLGKHVAAGSVFIANLAFWREAGYFDAAGTLKPMLHLWSLGIEEQFYLIWPPLLTLLYRWRVKPLPFLIVITLVSFALNVDWSRLHPMRDFYSMPSRLWELSLGGILAYVNDARTQTPAACASDCQQWLSFVGLALLTSSLVAFNQFQPFPGWRAALPTLGTFLLIAAGQHTWVNRHVLGNRLMVFVGLISYPLYLWHWPLLSFQRIVASQNLSTWDLLLTLATAVGLAWLTYLWVEQPIRTSRLKLRPALGLSVGMTIVGAVGLAVALQHLPPRSADHGLQEIIAASHVTSFPGPDLQDVGGSSTTGLMESAYRQGTVLPRVLFLGDSQAEQYYPRFDELLHRHPNTTRSILYSTTGGCPPIPHVKEDHLPECDGVIERGIELAKLPDVGTVVLVAGWMAYFDATDGPEIRSYYYSDGTTEGELSHHFGSHATDLAFESLQRMIEGFVADRKRVYLVLPSPRGSSFDPRAMISRSLLDYSFRIEPPRISAVSLVSTMSGVVTRLRQVAANAGATVIDPFEYLCNAAACPVISPDGKLMYRDGGHLNANYVRTDVSFLDHVLQQQDAWSAGSN